MGQKQKTYCSNTDTSNESDTEIDITVTANEQKQGGKATNSLCSQLSKNK